MGVDFSESCHWDSAEGPSWELAACVPTAGEHPENQSDTWSAHAVDCVALALLKDKPKPTDADIDGAITNICRCGTYQQVRAAIHEAANA
jgi:[2Fe-2S] binding domain